MVQPYKLSQTKCVIDSD